MASAGRGPSTLSADVSGQSETVGVVLILAIVVVGTGAVAVYGSSALEGTKDSTSLQRAEHQMTLFDSRTALVALGETNRRSVSLPATGGADVSVDRDAGWIRVVHRNYTSSSPPVNETIYNGSLGSVTYEQGDATVAYQGGGVWRTEDGSTRMVSPPEFHYRDATLTLPIIHVNGSSSAGGDVRATITAESQARHVFPNLTSVDPAGNETGAPYDAGGTYDNPVANGTVSVTVHSEHYRGWAHYFETRTEGNVSVDHDADTATVVLETVGYVGFLPQLPEEGNAIPIRGMAGGHPVENFTVILRDEDTSNGFKHTAFSFHAQSGGKKFQMMVYSDDKQRCDPADFEPLQVSVYFENSTSHQEWQNLSVDPYSGPIRLECTDYTGNSKPEPQIIVDFTSDLNLTYGEIQYTADPNNGDHASITAWRYDVGESLPGPAEFVQHEADVPWEPTSFSTGDRTTLDNLTNHFFSMMGPSIDLKVAEKAPGASERVVEADSFGTIDYRTTTGSQYITYLHVTENEVRVEVRE